MLYRYYALITRGEKVHALMVLTIIYVASSYILKQLSQV